MEPEQQQYDDPTEVMADESPRESLTWQASEFVQHDKEGVWFLGLAGFAILLFLLDLFIIRSITFGVLIVVMVLGVVVIARRAPQVISYALTPDGLQLNEKHFSFHDFRAFGVLQEGAMYSVRLIPQKRFMPPVNVFFPPEYGEQIVDVFGTVLPMEHIEPDIIDRLAERIRF